MRPYSLARSIIFKNFDNKRELITYLLGKECSYDFKHSLFKFYHTVTTF